MSADCEHRWVFQGVVYWSADCPMPGSSAHERIYGDRFFCERCLEQKTINSRAEGNTYGKPIPGTVPQ